MMQDEKQAILVEHNWAKGTSILMAYLRERLTNIFTNGNMI